MSQYTDQNSSTNNTSNKLIKSIDVGKKGLKIAKKASKTLLKGLASKTMLVLAIVFIFLLLFALIMSSIPSGILLKSEEDAASIEDGVYSVIEASYEQAKDNSKQAILNFLNENYNCKAKLSDISEENGMFVVSNDNCEINVTFTPNLEEVVGNISAYTTAVNGTIDYLNENKEMFVPSEYLFEMNDENELQLTDYGKRVYQENANEFNDSESDAYLSVISSSSSNFFVYEENSDRWDLNNFYLGTKTKIEERCYVTYINPTTKVQSTNQVACSISNQNRYSGLTNYKYEEREIEVEVPAWFGDIIIPIYYDLSSYKDEELNNAISYICQSTNKSEMEAASLVNSLLNDYYNNYYVLLKNGEDDNRNSYFEKLINDGVIIYVPISGLSSNFIQGEPGYDGEINVFGMNGTSVQIWNRIGQLRRNGSLSTNSVRYNCTEFANYWFYCVYGEGFVLSGDGHSMVSNLLNSEYGKNNFYLGSSPAPGAIYSIGSATSKYGHVGCVDAVDYENKIITISEGNYNGASNINAGIRIRYSMSFDEFYTYVKSCGGSQSSWVMFANPIQGN